MKIFAFKDAATGELSPPFIAKNDAVGIRLFKNFRDSLPENSKVDFSLLCVGLWSDVNGLITDDLEPMVAHTVINTDIDVVISDLTEVK
jgi:hypothetical protein